MAAPAESKKPEFRDLPLAQPPQPQKIRIDVFQQAETIQEEDCYSTAQKAATAVFENEYKQEMSNYPSQMDVLAVEWTRTQKTATKKDLAERIVLVTQWQAKRDSSVAALSKIKQAYDRAIAHCAPPMIDAETLKTLKKMRVKTGEIERLYIDLFLTQRKQLIDQNEEIASLILKIQESYKTLKTALEPTAYRLEAGTFGALSYGMSWGGTPYVDALRGARKAELEAQKGNVEESKEKEKA